MEYIPRSAENRVESLWKTGLIAILIGPRQSGKSTLLQKLARKLRQNGEEVFMVDGDYPYQWDILLNVPFMESRLNLIPSDRRIFMFIDELQKIDNGGTALKRIYDKLKERVRFVATGSVFLWGKRGIGENLTGRAIEIELPPLSFSEVVSYKVNVELTPNNLFDFYKGYRKEISELWNEVIEWGLFPQVYAAEKVLKKDFLAALAGGFIKRDIISILPRGDWSFFRSLIQILSSEPGILNITRISRELKRDEKTVIKYIDAAEELLILKRIRPFYKSVRAEIRKAPRILFVDCGLCSAMAGQYPPQLGFILEQAVGAELWKSGAEVRFWRTQMGTEVDFIIDENIPVEVKSGYRGGRISRGFRSFIKTYQPPVAFWLQPGEPHYEDYLETRIWLMPAPLFVLALQNNALPGFSIGN